MRNIRLVINNDIQKKEKEKFFVKKELQCILNLYAKMVSNGSWKDYSLSSGINSQFLLVVHLICISYWVGSFLPLRDSKIRGCYLTW